MLATGNFCKEEFAFSYLNVWIYKYNVFSAIHG